MPCHTIQTSTVALKVADLDLLLKAVQSMGYTRARIGGDTLYFQDGSQSFNKATGELRVILKETASELKRAYSAEIVKAQAKKYGWALKQTGQYQYEVSKR